MKLAAFLQTRKVMGGCTKMDRKSSMIGEAFSLFPSFIKLFPDLSGLGPSSYEILAHHCRVCKSNLIQKACAPPTSLTSSYPTPPHHQLHSDSLCLSYLSPFCSIFHPVELFQEIDSYAKQCSKEHNAERIWEWVLKKKSWQETMCKFIAEQKSIMAMQTSWESGGFHNTLQPLLGWKHNFTSLCNVHP